MKHVAGEFVNCDSVDTLGGLCIHCVCMRIVKEKFLRDAAGQYPKATKWLAAWVVTVRAATWRGLADVRRAYPSADMVRVSSGKPALVFNVCGNTYRLIVAMHFDRQTAYTLRFLTHAEYSTDRWKDEL
jgi:mRNA interferase HigB